EKDRTGPRPVTFGPSPQIAVDLTPLPPLARREPSPRRGSFGLRLHEPVRHAGPDAIEAHFCVCLKYRGSGGGRSFLAGMGRRPWLPVLGEGTEVADSGPSLDPGAFEVGAVRPGGHQVLRRL